MRPSLLYCLSPMPRSFLPRICSPWPHRRPGTLAALALGLLVALALPAPAAGSGLASAAISGVASENGARVIVKYRDDTALLQNLAAVSNGTTGRPQYAGAFGQRMGLALHNGRVLGQRTQVLHGGTALDSDSLATRLATQPEVEWAVPDLRRGITALPNDPYLPGGQTVATPAAGQWYLRAPDATTPAAIDAVGAWERVAGSAAVTVAVLDTGVLTEHPDLAGKLWPGYDFVSDTSTANDGDSRDADPGDPGDWTTTNQCATGQAATASSWHGTQVAGLVGAATDNGIGIAGTGRDLMVLPVRVLGRCGGYDSDIIAAMRWAAGLSAEVGSSSSVQVANPHPARVINLSLGSSGSCLASWREAIAELQAAGVTVVVAAGNDTGHAISTPANCPGALAVTGVRHIGTKVGYSNLGPQAAIAAPAGNCVSTTGTCQYALVTTTNTGTTTPLLHTYSDGDTRASIGTSFSAPLVSGTVGLMLAANPSLTPAQIRTAVQATATPFPTTGADSGTAQCRAPGNNSSGSQLECYCTTSTCGAGILNAAQAVASVMAAVVPVAQITAQETLAVGSSTVLSAEGSTTASGRSITGYRWSLTSGATLASLSGASDQATVTLQALETGTVVVQLDITDDTGATASTVAAMQITAAGTETDTGTVDSGTGGTSDTGGGSTTAVSGGSGGGAFDGVWLALIAACLEWARRRRRRFGNSTS